MIYVFYSTMYEQLQFELPKKPFINEKSFTAWFWCQIHNIGWFRHKISDMSIDAKPCDSIIGFNWLFALVEFKIGKEIKKVDVYKKLRPCQAFGLSRYKKNWWVSLVIYYNQLHHQYRVMEYNEQLLITFTVKEKI